MNESTSNSTLTREQFDAIRECLLWVTLGDLVAMLNDQREGLHWGGNSVRISMDNYMQEAILYGRHDHDDEINKCGDALDRYTAKEEAVTHLLETVDRTKLPTSMTVWEALSRSNREAPTPA